MKLVLQCGMCGTHHPVGTAVCSTCRASGVTQLRLMLECPTCGQLGITPTCERCPPVVALDLDEELIIAEEVIEELEDSDEELEEDEFEDFDLDLDLDDEDEDEAIVFDLSEEDDETEYDEDEDEDWEELEEEEDELEDED